MGFRLVTKLVTLNGVMAVTLYCSSESVESVGDKTVVQRI